MDDLVQRLAAAKSDQSQLDALIRDYLPLITSEAAKVTTSNIDHDDKVSLATETFMNCVRRYDAERGSFVGFVSTSIHNRLIDESKRSFRIHSRSTEFDPDDATPGTSPADRAALNSFNHDQHRDNVAAEVAEFTTELARHGLTFSDLAQTCPRQRRSRNLCAKIARTVHEDAELLAGFGATRHLPRAVLADRLQISAKTLDKHRIYIVALLIVLIGDFPHIGSYIPALEEAK